MTNILTPKPGGLGTPTTRRLLKPTGGTCSPPSRLILDGTNGQRHKCLYVQSRPNSRLSIWFQPPAQGDSSGWAVQVSKTSPGTGNSTAAFAPAGRSVRSVGLSSVPVDRCTSTRAAQSVFWVVFSTVPTKLLDAESNDSTSLTPFPDPVPGVFPSDVLARFLCFTHQSA